MGFYYYDWTYFIIMLPALLLTLWAQIRVKSAFSQFSQVNSRREMTGRDAAEAVLRMHQVAGVQVEPVSGRLTDHYDPRSNRIRLSDGVFGSTSVAAIGVAAHEAGHAVQHAEGYGPIRLRTAMVPVVQFSSRLAMPLILIGLLLPVEYSIVTTIGILVYAAATLFELVTLPVEFNASARALKSLGETGILDEEELKGAKKVLQAAAMTYLASAFTALLSLLRLILIFGRRNNRNN